ncbi:unnamed protein product [Heterosigma akashiwo]
MRTLIRCHFSPVETTAQRYVISGSGDGNIVIWDILNAEVAAEMAWHRECVRDVAWHPRRPLIASSSWDHSVGLWTYREEENAPLGGRLLGDNTAAATAANDATERRRNETDS